MKKHIIMAASGMAVSCIIGLSFAGSSSVQAGAGFAGSRAALADSTVIESSQGSSSSDGSTVSTVTINPVGTGDSSGSSASGSSGSGSDGSGTGNNDSSAVNSSSGSATGQPAGSSTTQADQKSAAIAKENTRHQQALDAINDKYDPQINTLTTQSQQLIDSGAKDVSDQITALQKTCDDQFKQVKYWASRNGTSDGMFEYNFYLQLYNENTANLSDLEQTQADYNQLQDDQHQIDLLNSEKNHEISLENDLFSSNIDFYESLYS